MVVREQKGDVADQNSMHSQWTSTTVKSEGDEDSSSSSDQHSAFHSGQSKRKVDEMDEDRETKRRKNREAAKRCRDKKQKQTEDLKYKNSELEKENCQLAKQRDELVRKCKEYQREIEQHKQQGCVVPHFSPPYNLEHLLPPSTPPSPSFSESAPSTSSCPSPASSISPGPPCRYPPSVRADIPHHQSTSQENMSSWGNNCVEDLATGTKSNTRMSMATPASPAVTQITPDSNQLHFLKIRNNDGNYKLLCLDHENYTKVMHKVKAQRAAAAKTTQSEPMLVRTPVTSVTQQIPFLEEQESQNSMNTEMSQSPLLPFQSEEKGTNQKSEQKLDTCEDLLSILKTHVKDTGEGFELKPVNEDEVLIKKEPLDTEYEQNSLLNLERQSRPVGIKQEATWTSTGQHLRTRMDTLTNQDDLSSPTARIQNIVQYLERDEHIVPANTIQQSSQTVRQTQVTQSPSARPAQRTTYITSSASVAALNKMKIGNRHTSSVAQQNTSRQVSCQYNAQPQKEVQDSFRQQHNLITQPKPTIKLRPGAASLATSASNILDGKSQAAFLAALPDPASHTAAQEMIRRNAVKASKANSFSSVTAETQRQTVTDVSLCDSSIETIQSTNTIMQMIPGQQLSTTSSLQTLQQDSVSSYQHPASSTIVTSTIASLPQQDATPTGNLMSESSSVIAEYLKTNSIETLDS